MQKTIRSWGFVLALGAVGLNGCAGGAGSNSESPAEQVASVTPTSVEAGSRDITLVVKGSSFDKTSQVLWNGLPQSTRFVDTQTLNAVVAAAELTSPQGIAVAVRWGSSSKVSNAVPFVVKAAPSKSSLQITTSCLADGEAGAGYTATLTAQGGTSPYRWSLMQGNLPSGLALDSWSGQITGSPGPAGTFAFTVQAQDSSATPSSAEVTLTITIAKAPIPPMGTPSTFYGPGIGADSLGNTPLGPNQQKVSYRFRAKETGNINSVHFYLIMDHPGYSAGTGGKVQVSLQTDDGTRAHNPSGTSLSTALIPAPFAVAAPARYFPVLSFSPAPHVTGGELYHVVFENTDASPTVNYVSTDELYQDVPPEPIQPTSADTDSAVLMYQNYWPDGLRWKPRSSHTPILQLDYANGQAQGQGYMEVWIGVPEPISGDRQVRESFTVTGSTRIVSSVGVRLARISGNDSLTIRLEAADGSLIESGAINPSELPIATPATYVWVDYTFSSSHTLLIGKTYRLVLQAPASSVYQAYPVRKGTAYGFSPTTYFSDGHAESLKNGTWSGWTQWGAADRVDGDLQFYFGIP